MVRRGDHHQGDGSTSEVVFAGLPAASVGESRAAASGRAAVQIVERRVEVPIAAAPRRQDWPRLLGDLAHQLDDGRIYGRDLLSLSVALNGVLEAFTRRSGRVAHRQG